MPEERPYVLSIAGFDPSGGAGILADIKTMEACGVNGLGVCTSITYQNDNEFKGLDWLSTEQIISQIEILLSHYSIDVIKIGLVKDLKTLFQLIQYLKSKNESCKIIWDPIIRSSSGFEFHSLIDKVELEMILKNITLITPNIPEAEKLQIDHQALHCSCLLKGGHSTAHANDILYSEGIEYIIQGERFKFAEKHGSGCVLSSSIAAGLAKGLTLLKACQQAKSYTASFLKSTETLLGVHAPIKLNEYV